MVVTALLSIVNGTEDGLYDLVALSSNWVIKT